ncbi:hypothetical protein BH23GEM7_BH23GEM7_33250 [soil metagenome]
MSTSREWDSDGHCEIDPLTGRCATCADEGIEGRVLALIGGSLAEVEMEGQVREVAMDLLDQVAIGDLVLVHAGVAIAHLGR